MTMPKGWRSPRLDDRIQKMQNLNDSEIALKQWMITRIGYELQAFKDGVKSSKDKYDTFSDEWQSTVANR
jgi:hypothetical protein